MKKGIVLLIPLLVLVSGCIPTIIGAAVYKSSKTRQAKESFIEQFNATNLEREKAGLPPLDLCTEKYGFDKKWADDDPVCAERIAKYEAGDKTARVRAGCTGRADSSATGHARPLLIAGGAACLHRCPG